MNDEQLDAHLTDLNKETEKMLAHAKEQQALVDKITKRLNQAVFMLCFALIMLILTIFLRMISAH